MGAVEQAESTDSQLSAEELRQFRAWFEELDADQWDREFEEDAKSGKLDGLAARAIEDFHAGRCKEL